MTPTLEEQIIAQTKTIKTLKADLAVAEDFLALLNKKKAAADALAEADAELAAAQDEPEAP